jgi:hypothetical protein
MIFIIPIILGAAALIAAGAGVVAGVDGASKMGEARRIGEAAQKRYEEKYQSVENTFQATQALAKEYGQLQIQVKLHTIGGFVAFIKRIGRKASQSDMKFLEGLEGCSPEQIQKYKAEALEAERFAAGGFKALGAAYAAGQGTVALVGLFGTASTGAAIGGLSGAAAWNATLAWLGGGSLAAGGGGMALGTLVLGGITVGPALMIGGFVLGGQGEKQLTEAYRYEAEVNTEIAKLDAFEDFLGQIQGRITELKNLVKTLNNRAIESLADLDPQSFREFDAEKFQQAKLLIKTLFKDFCRQLKRQTKKLKYFATTLSNKDIKSSTEAETKPFKNAFDAEKFQQAAFLIKALFKDFFRQVKRQIKKLKYFATTLSNKDIEGSTEAETKPFEDEFNAEKFQQVALLIKALTEIMRTPVLDNGGDLNQATAQLKEKYDAI